MIRETIYRDELKTVVLENEVAELILLPQKGCEFHKFRLKANGLDILHVNKDVVESYIRDKQQGNAKPLNEYFFAGLHTMFPNAGLDQIYDGIVYDYHGDLRKMEWTSQFKQDDAGKSTVHLKASSEKVPLAFERWISLDSDKPYVTVKDRIFHNGGGEKPVPYIYGIHPYHSYPLMDEGTICKVGGKVTDLLPSRSEPYMKLEFTAVEGIGNIEIWNPHLSSGIRFRFAPDLFKWVWRWFQFDPITQQYVCAFIPCTAEGHDGISGAYLNGSIRYLNPGESFETVWSMEILKGDV